MISTRKGLIVGVVAFVVMGLLGYQAKQQDDCEDRGGSYVRSTLWFECVAPR